MTAANVALVDQAFARRYRSGGNPIGRHIRSVFGGGRQFEIVGMVADERYMDIRAEPQPHVYLPSWPFGEAAFYVRTDLRPESLFAAIRKEVEGEAPGVPLYELRTMEDQVSRSLRDERISATLASAFGLLAVLLAAIGLYGVMAYSVTRRTREIGIRMALGARAGAVRSLVLREVFWVVAAGLGIGLLCALWLTGLLKTWLWGVEPNDPPTLAAAAVLVAAVAGLAGFLPAWRASRIDPMRALRWE
jgi:predicted lysophospholipase L1 biosynthesis ABC-type transport system permease subunit